MNGARFFTDGLTDSTSQPWPSPTPTVVPGLVVCPIPVLALGVFPGAAGEIYRFAYERALAAQRPSLYELSLLVSRN